MDPITGEIRFFAGPKIPVNWHACDGSTVSIQQYPALFSLIGTTYGGDGVSTFGLPDLRGRAIVSQGTALSKTVYTLGSHGGTETVTLAQDNIVTHTHSFTVGATPATTQSPSGSFLAEPQPNTTYAYVPTNITGVKTASIAAGALTSSGGNQAHENRQPYLPVNYLICLNGIYPEFPS
ncbi:hypothetical protein BEL04_14670 [Mucilaginibacter sp. PPCGB 2223]|uniref:phage tail protein n=1 Tax=Mucilaginibacter sp. PPCGB 2223 TaxID=1886027 RepID=UPI0008253F96|nr:tail fiber protein [Mucilaginibacter sp. PPCGB 2223]OCX52687.1 hypothetical protein BEL04_14670 [Mucilaginibacter sp. PPCGB 2223]